MTVASKNVYFTFLEDIVNKYKYTYHKTNEMKSVDVKSTSYTENNVDSNEKDPKFEVGDHVRMSKYENIFVKGFAPNWTKNVFVIKKVKNTVPWTYVINNLNGEWFSGTSYEKELQKTNQEIFTTKKGIKRKRNKLYVKWRGCDNWFNG